MSPGVDVEAARVDHRVALRGCETFRDRGDPATGEQDVADGMETLRWIENGAALDQHAGPATGGTRDRLLAIAPDCSSVRPTGER